MKQVKQLMCFVLSFVLTFLFMGCGSAENNSAETASITEPLQEETFTQETAALETVTTAPTISEPDAFREISYTTDNTLASGLGLIYSYQVTEVTEGFHIVIDYSVPAGMDAGAYLWSNMKREVLWEKEPFTTGQRDIMEFDITAEQLAKWEDLNIAFGSEDTGYFSVATELPFHFLQTNGQPISTPIELGYAVDSELKTGNYEIYSCTVQELDNDHFRFTIDFTATADMSVTVFRSPDEGHQIFHQSSTTGEKQQLIFDLSRTDIASTSVLMLNFSINDHDRFFLNIPTTPILNQLSGSPIGEAQELPCFEVQAVENCSFLHGSVQLLDTNYYRYTLLCDVPAETQCTVEFGNDRLYFASGTSGDTMCLQFDVDQATAASTAQFYFTAYPQNGKQYILTFENPVCNQ